MLRAIAIYEHNAIDGKFTRKDAVEKPGTLFFPNNDLAFFEGNTLPQLEHNIELLSGEVMFSDKKDSRSSLATLFGGSQETEYYYAMYVPETSHLHVLISKSELFQVEPRYLLINVNHVDQRSEKVATTLSDILRNPIGYTGRDILTRAVRQDIEKVKVVALNAKVALTERGERLTTVEQKSEMLYEKSNTFKLQAENLEKNYTCCGGILRNPWR